MKPVFFVAGVALLVGLATAAKADVVLGPVTTITGLMQFSEFGGGDVAIKVAQSSTGCADGYWLRPSDPGFKTLYAQVLASYVSKLPIQFYGFTTELWPGSPTGQFCRVYGILPQ